MTAKSRLLQELEQASDDVIEEVLNFLLSAKQRQTSHELRQEQAGEATELQSSKPIWEIAQDIVQDMSAEEAERLPSDGAEQHDHYIYGLPKRLE